jgi:uncharacterized damage-inducible protein DinB
MLPVLVLAVAVPASAQQGAVAGVGTTYGMVKGYIVRAAEQVPEEHYSFRPTPEVRTFGQLVAHVADANYMICSAATGEPNPNQVEIEKTVTAKAALVQAVKESFAYCDKAYQLPDAKALEAVNLFGMLQTNRIGALAFNAAHDMEHYGNLVTYMRMKGLVPPSSQPRGQ